MNFDDTYTKLLGEANNIYPIFEYVEDEVITENPDDFYAEKSSSFIVCGDFYAVASQFAEGGHTHGDILTELEAHVVNGDPVSDDVMIGGTISKALRAYFFDTYSNDYDSDKYGLNRDGFMNQIDGGILGRIIPSDKIVSFWNSAEDFDQPTIMNILKLISTVYKDKPKSYRYEIANASDYYDSELLSYTEFTNLGKAQIQPTPTPKKRDTSHIVHNLDPAIKGQVMKLQGVKPKKGLGAEARFLMGEDTE